MPIKGLKKSTGRLSILREEFVSTWQSALTLHEAVGVFSTMEGHPVDPLACSQRASRLRGEGVPLKYFRRVCA